MEFVKKCVIMTLQSNKNELNTQRLYKKLECIKVHIFGLEKTPLKISEVFFSWYNY